MDKVIESIASKIANRFVVKNQIPEDKKELYEYGALIAIQSAINILFTLLLGFVSGMFFENLCFFIAFKILRKYSGGLHSSKFSVCFIISISSNILVLLTLKILEIYPNYILLFIFEAVSFLIVLIFAPVNNNNKPISKKEAKIYKVIVCGACIVLIITSVILVTNNSFYAFVLGMSMVLNSFLIIIEKIKGLLRC